MLTAHRCSVARTKWALRVTFNPTTEKRERDTSVHSTRRASTSQKRPDSFSVPRSCWEPSIVERSPRSLREQRSALPNFQIPNQNQTVSRIKFFGALNARLHSGSDRGARSTICAEDRFMRFKRSAVTEDILLTRSNIGNISNVNRNGTNTARGYNTSHGLTTVTGGTTQTYDNVRRQSAGGLRVNRIIAELWHRGVFCSRRRPTREFVLGAQPPEDWRCTLLGASPDGTQQLDKLRPFNSISFRKLPNYSGSKFPAGATAGIQGLNENGYVGGNRIWKKITRSGSVVEHRVHIHAGPNLIAEYNAGVAASTPVQEYVYGDEIDSLVLIRRSDATKYGVTRNRQWSITALHDLANGTIVERYAYEITGKRTIYAANGTTVRTTSSFGNNFGYTNRWHDEESGLMYFRARYYNPLTGEFLSRDPIGFVDGMSLNRGYFVLNGTDPRGLEFLCWKFDHPMRGKAEALLEMLLAALKLQPWWNFPIPSGAVKWVETPRPEWVPDYVPWGRWEPEMTTVGDVISGQLKGILAKFTDEWYLYFRGWRQDHPCGCDLDGVPRLIGRPQDEKEWPMGLVHEGQFTLKYLVAMESEHGATGCENATQGTPKLPKALPQYIAPTKCDEEWGASMHFKVVFGIDWEIDVNVLGVAVKKAIKETVTIPLESSAFRSFCSKGSAAKCPPGNKPKEAL